MQKIVKTLLLLFLLINTASIVFSSDYGESKVILIDYSFFGNQVNLENIKIIYGDSPNYDFRDLNYGQGFSFVFKTKEGTNLGTITIPDPRIVYDSSELMPEKGGFSVVLPFFFKEIETIEVHDRNKLVNSSNIKNALKEFCDNADSICDADCDNDPDCIELQELEEKYIKKKPTEEEKITKEKPIAIPLIPIDLGELTIPIIIGIIGIIIIGIIIIVMKKKKRIKETKKEETKTISKEEIKPEEKKEIEEVIKKLKEEIRNK